MDEGSRKRRSEAPDIASEGMMLVLTTVKERASLRVILRKWSRSKHSTIYARDNEMYGWTGRYVHVVNWLVGEFIVLMYPKNLIC
jgi:hypothetical protein